MVKSRVKNRAGSKRKSKSRRAPRRGTALTPEPKRAGGADARAEAAPATPAPELTAKASVPQHSPAAAGGHEAEDTLSQGFDWDVFISYSSADGETALRVVQALKGRGIRVWIDKEQIKPGDIFVTKIAEGLETSAAVAILISPDAVASKWVEEEYTRAISLTKRATNPVRVIPVLLRKATLPSFLANRSWVDLQDESKFEANVQLLMEGIRRGTPARETVPSGKRKSSLLQVSFLWFFPEGMLPDLYADLISKMGAGVAARAEEEGVVRVTDGEGLELIGAAPERIRELRSYITNEAEKARELLPLVHGWMNRVYLFKNFVKIGFGRALLLRDLLTLAGCIPREDDDGQEARDEVCQLARRFLPLIIDENHLRVGAEISKALLDLSSFPQPEDSLIYARLLLLIGEPGRAADIFDIYVNENLFDELGLSEIERVQFAMDWAIALKNSGQGGSRHQNLVGAYRQMLDLLSTVSAAGGNEPEWLRLEADIRSNRATQLAQYGDVKDWPDAVDDFDAASKTYQQLKDNERLLAAQANFVSHSLDHADRLSAGKATVDLGALLKLLEELDAVASVGSPSKDLFLFFYQKARLLKRLYPYEPQRAAEAYELAGRVAQKAGLKNRHPIAYRWVVLLKWKASEISEEDYLLGLRECAAALKFHTEDSWAAHSLSYTLLEIAELLRKRRAYEDAWACLVEAFEIEAKRYGQGSSDARLLNILKLMDKLNVSDEVRAPFISTNAEFIGKLAQIPSYDFQWGALMKKIKA